MDEYQKRQAAVQRVLSGEKVAKVARSYGKSRPWVYQWIRRYQSAKADAEWYKDASKAPVRIPTKLDKTTEGRILQVRSELEDRNYAQTGAIAIQYEFKSRGWAIPQVWTINRVLSRNKVINKSSGYKLRKDYPELFIHTHQMDLVGPRYIKGDGSFYSVNLIDTLTHSAFGKGIRHKGADQIIPALVAFWQTHGMPDALQMDNELSFRGANRYPRSFGKVIRFALSQGVAPVFIPVKEPWRNGMIEKFNHTYGKRFLKSTKFEDFNDLCRQEKDFFEFHNQYHRYSAQQHKTPNQMVKEIGAFPKYQGTIHQQNKIPLIEGAVYFIRFIRSDLILWINSEKLKVDPALKYAYVVAEVNIDGQCIFIRQNGQIAQIIDYPTPVDW